MDALKKVFQIEVKKEDVDEDDLTLDARDLPDGCGFTDNHDGTGTLLWETDHEVVFLPAVRQIVNHALDQARQHDRLRLKFQEAGVDDGRF